MRKTLLALMAVAAVAGCDTAGEAQQMNLRAAPATAAEAGDPQTAGVEDVAMRWGNRRGSDAWTQATLKALDQHGVTILSRVPSDIAAFCPGYAQQDESGRKAFWAGLLSAVAKHESTYNPQASGGGGRWIGLMQIAPATWRHYGCSGNIRNGADNMACAVKIMSRQVGRDNAVARAGGGWGGIARDWAPLRNSGKRADIANWTKNQSYCQRGA